MGRPVWHGHISLWGGMGRLVWHGHISLVTWADRCDMYLLIDLALIQWESLSIRPSRTNRVQSLFRPVRFDELQYYSGRGPLARAVRQIVKLGIRYGTGNSTEWSEEEPKFSCVFYHCGLCICPHFERVHLEGTSNDPSGALHCAIAWQRHIWPCNEEV